jgi:hypothetical protein
MYIQSTIQINPRITRISSDRRTRGIRKMISPPPKKNGDDYTNDYDRTHKNLKDCLEQRIEAGRNRSRRKALMNDK